MESSGLGTSLGSFPSSTLTSERIMCVLPARPFAPVEFRQYFNSHKGASVGEGRAEEQEGEGGLGDRIYILACHLHMHFK